VTATLGPLVVEAAEPAAVQRFWRGALGGDAFRRNVRVVPERGPKVVKNRVHPDVYVNDVDPLLTLGATVLARYPEWTTLADVEGNEFCAFPGDEEMAAPARLFAVCTDSDRPEELAAWWADRVGATVGAGPDGTPRWLHGCAGWDDVVWKFVRNSDERVAPNRWRWSVMEWAGTSTDPQGNDFSAE
jgi:hypothetical protein